MRFLIAPLLGVFALLFAPAALAAPGDKEAAQGINAARGGFCKRAIPLLESAEQKRHRPSSAVALADCYAKLGALLKASEIYHKVAGEKKEPAYTARDVAAITEAKKKAARLDARIPTLAVKPVEPYEGLVVEIDGEVISEPSVPRRFDPGVLRVVGRADGFEEVSQWITLREKQRREIKLRLKPKPGARKPAEKGEPSASKPAEKREQSASKPAKKGAPSASKPAEKREQSASKPAKKGAPSASKPAERRAPSASKPTEKGEPSASKPAERREPSARKPAEKRSPSARRPAEKREPSARRPAEKGAPSASKPAERRAPSASKPVEKEAPSASKSAETKPPAPPRVASHGDETGQIEESKAHDLWLGAGFQGFFIPRFVFGLFGEGGRDVLVPGGDVALTTKLGRRLDLVLSISYGHFGLGETPFKPKGHPDTDYEIIESDLQALQANARLLWNLPLDTKERFAFRVGVGLGVGWTFLGDLYRTQAYPGDAVEGDPSSFVPGDPYRYVKCRGPNNPAGSFRYCNQLDYDADHYPGYVEPSWFTRPKGKLQGLRPLVYPWLVLPEIGLEAQPWDGVAFDLRVGASVTGFLGGLGVRFAL